MKCLTVSLSECDVVIEAVFEDLKVKQELFSQLDGVCKALCILATNTSSLDIDLIFNRVGIARYGSSVCVCVYVK
jgi:3-hydroxyacyl-CoA dehydrogenase